MQQFTRSALYELVCASPLSKFALTLGTQGTKLAAICREHNVPYPGSSYWTRKSLGMDAELPPLPPFNGAEEPLITIEPYEPKQRKPRGTASVDERAGE